MDLNHLIQLDHEWTLALNGSDSIFWDNVMFTYTNTFSWTLVIITLLTIIFKNNTPQRGFAILLTMILLIAVADRLCSGLVKPLVARWRPTQDPELMYLVDIVRGYRGGLYGFFSGHACNTMCMATFLSWLFRYRNVTITLVFWSLSTTFTRIYLGVHHLGDILVGFTIGVILGTLFYFLMSYLMKRFGKSGKMISSSFTPTGYLVDDMHVLLTVIFANYILVTVFAMFLSF
ncbi:MAG: phosphatase PAP2 family protein [Bacteroidaceae bacterium]|nr:phosphatase PAP2 family protein [Bacteroidaceae bacterium]MBP5523318.1 phosphatase PAP2 family protein [Bacteroidaceae bacterium]